MLYDRISLISEMLDATLNLRCFYIKGEIGRIKAKTRIFGIL